MNIFVFDIETIPDVESGRRLYDLQDLDDAATGKAMLQMRQQKTGKQDSDRVQTPEKGDNDRGEAVAGRDRCPEQSRRPGNFRDSGKAGQSAGDKKGGQDHALAAEAGERAGSRYRSARPAYQPGPA